MLNQSESSRWGWKRILKPLMGITVLILSGIAGAVYQDFRARALPQLLVTSIGFRGPTVEPLRLSDSLLAQWDKSILLESPSRYEDFNQLVTREREIGEYLEQLVSTSRLLQEWTGDSHRGLLEPVSRILGHPCIKGRAPVCRKLTTRLIFEGRLPFIPVTAVQGTHSIVPVFRVTTPPSTDYWAVTEGSKRLFDVESSFTEKQKTILQNLARSFEFGNDDVIRRFSEAIMASANSEHVVLTEVQRLLREILLPEARITVSASIYNAGGRAVAVRPYFQFKFRSQGSWKKIPLSVMDSTQAEIEEATRLLGSVWNSPMFSKSGKDVRVEEFLPSSGTAQYINITPGAISGITLVATQRLGDQASTLKELFKASSFEVQLRGLTTDGKVFQTSPSMWGTQLDDTKILGMFDSVD